ncbi:hypothetical protein P4S95_10265 [Aneurinibacillus aneurinilyticus]|uniref:hypothetical protein n=1 Tax=Aneurinibacillus aneurinilyticus TaxID=1391 RepID=UPI002E1BDE2A|nr:hypothetical protein [Aneurinibacillus aneurinilyticus]
MKTTEQRLAELEARVEKLEAAEQATAYQINSDFAVSGDLEQFANDLNRFLFAACQHLFLQSGQKTAKEKGS